MSAVRDMDDDFPTLSSVKGNFCPSIRFGALVGTTARASYDLPIETKRELPVTIDDEFNANRSRRLLNNHSNAIVLSIGGEAPRCSPPPKTGGGTSFQIMPERLPASKKRSDRKAMTKNLQDRINRLDKKDVPPSNLTSYRIRSDRIPTYINRRHYG